MLNNILSESLWNADDRFRQGVTIYCDSLMMPTRIIMKMDNKDEDDKEQLIMIKTKKI